MPVRSITGTFLDEISHDIPHQNWGEKEWEKDFAAMQGIGIDTVILIRCGHKRWMTFPSETIRKIENGYVPPVDLVEMFLRLSEKFGMKFFLGTYDSGRPWWREGYDVEFESDLMRRVIDEAWSRYGHCPAFAGWYFSQEIARRNPAAVACYERLGTHCKSFSANLQIMISPGISGPKAMNENGDFCQPIAIEQHEREWNENMQRISPFVDIVAFQDGHLDFHQLPEFLAVNKMLCDRYGICCWSNVESFDRDMPWRFPPIKWEKLLLKMNAAAQAGVEKLITFEFSHFMSPNSCYPQAHGLFDRYREYLLTEAGILASNSVTC